MQDPNKYNPVKLLAVFSILVFKQTWFWKYQAGLCCAQTGVAGSNRTLSHQAGNLGNYPQWEVGPDTDSPEVAGKDNA